MPELTLSNIFLYFSLALVLLWTVRLARSKGKNPFLWGGIAFLLMLIPDWSALLAMGPMVVLLFMKAPQEPVEESVQDAVTCPKCRAYHALGHTYCVNCGWELNRPYADSAGQSTETNVAQTIHLEQTAEALAAPELAESPAEVDNSSVTSYAGSSTVEGPAAEAPSVDVEEEVTPASPPKPVVSRPVTPARFTEQGLERLGEGHLQEAIDQFSKALALDPAYVPALVQRAEAYFQQGREDKAAEDRQQLEALGPDPTSI